MEEYKYNGFKYIKDYQNTEVPITVEHGKKKPENIFKFYGLSRFSVDALTKGYFYTSHPIELNDILDSSPFLFYTSKPLDFEYYDKFLGFLYEGKEEELIKYYEEDSREPNLCKGYIFQLWETMTNIFGIISTTGKENNPLMWPHYTQEKGFQIKFKTDELEKSIPEKLTEDEEFLGLYPVNYTSTLHPIEISQFRAMFIPFYYSVTVKIDTWEYEDEWRFLIGKQQMGVPYSKSGFSPREDYLVKKENRYTYYDKSIVKEITLGMNFFNGRDFEIKRVNDKIINVKPKEIESNWEFKSQQKLLDYLCTDLNDKFYYSGVKYELDEQEKPYLIRTKENMLIKKLDDGFYQLTKTENIIKLMEKPAWNNVYKK